MNLDALTHTSGEWLRGTGPESDIVISSRIRLARNPSGRFGKPEEIVHMAVYLASDESRWTNGASLVVDGGITVNYF